MMTAKIFENDGSQAVRLPQKCCFQTSEVAVNKIGDIVMLIPKWEPFLQAVDMFSDDFLVTGREKDFVKERESL